MKNRYCQFCGTLLPEDGVCLRCGAKYELADDGQLKVIPRKVKKVAVKATPKKKITVKKAIDPSEAETQTIPEDVFSFSDDTKGKEKHTDWTGDSGVGQRNTGSEYNPNFVLKEESFPEQKQSFGEQINSSKMDSSISKKKENKGISTGTLIGLFLFFAAFAGCLSYLFLNNRSDQTQAPISMSETTIVENSSSVSATTDNGLQEIAFATHSLECENLPETGQKINARYLFDETTGKLTITESGLINDAIVLFPLVDDGKLPHRHATLSDFEEEIYEYNIMLCESDFIKNGIIKEIVIETREDTYTNRKTFQFDVKDGYLKTAYIVSKTNYDDSTYADEFNNLYSVINYGYGSNNELKSIDDNTETEEGTPFLHDRLEFQYGENGYLQKVVERSSAVDGVYKHTKRLNYNGSQLTQVAGEEDPWRTTFEYDEIGRLVNCSFTYDIEDGTGVFYDFKYSSDHIQSIYSASSRMGDGTTYTFS